MKNLFLILLVAISLCVTSCSSEPETITLPIEVTTLMSANKFDTVLVVNTQDAKYLFDKNNQFIEKIPNENQDDIPVWLEIIIGFLFFVLIMF